MSSPSSLQLDYKTFLEKVSNREVTVYADNWGSIVAAKNGAYSDASGLMTFYGGIVIFLGSIACSYYLHWACFIAGLFIMLKMIGMSTRMRHQNFIHACIRNPKLYDLALENNWLYVNRNVNYVEPKINYRVQPQEKESKEKFLVNRRAQQSDIEKNKQQYKISNEDIGDEPVFHDTDEKTEKELIDNYILSVEAYIQVSPYWHKYSKLNQNQTFHDYCTTLLAYCEKQSVKEKIVANVLMEIIYDKTDVKNIIEALEHELRQMESGAWFEYNFQKYYLFSPDETDDRKYFFEGVAKVKNFLIESEIEFTDIDLTAHQTMYAIVAISLRGWDQRAAQLSTLKLAVGYNMERINPELAKKRTAQESEYCEKHQCFAHFNPLVCSSLDFFDGLFANTAIPELMWLFKRESKNSNQISESNFKILFDQLLKFSKEEIVPRMKNSHEKMKS